jgi:hypothetical protein
MYQWIAIPYSIGGVSEIFISIPAYGLAYSRAPKNLKGVVFALYLLATSVSYIIGLASSSVIKDPYLLWDFGGACIACAIIAPVFYFLFRDLDKEEYHVSENGDYHLELEKKQLEGLELEKKDGQSVTVIEDKATEIGR